MNRRNFIKILGIGLTGMLIGLPSLSPAEEVDKIGTTRHYFHLDNSGRTLGFGEDRALAEECALNGEQTLRYLDITKNSEGEILKVIDGHYMVKGIKLNNSPRNI